MNFLFNLVHEYCYDLPKPIFNFLLWYFNPRGKMNRLSFNLVIFLVFIPIYVLQINQISEQAGGISKTINSSGQLLHQAFGDIPNGTPKQQLDYIHKQQAALEELAEVTDIEHFVKKDYKSKSLSSIEIINMLIYIMIIPIMAMRYRDLGIWDNNKIIMYTSLIYVPIILEFLDNALALGISKFYSLPINLVSGITLMYLCSKKSAKVIPPSERNLYD